LLKEREDQIALREAKLADGERYVNEVFQKNQKEVEETRAFLARKSVELEEKENALKIRASELEQMEADLKQREEELDRMVSEVEKRMEIIRDEHMELSQKEEQLDVLLQAQNEIAQLCLPVVKDVDVSPQPLTRASSCFCFNNPCTIVRNKHKPGIPAATAAQSTRVIAEAPVTPVLNPDQDYDDESSSMQTPIQKRDTLKPSIYDRRDAVDSNMQEYDEDARLDLHRCPSSFNDLLGGI